MANTEQSKLAAALKKKYKKGYASAKKAEASSGGRLPGGLRDAVGAITGMQLQDSQYGPTLKVTASCEDPEEHKGRGCGFFINLTDDRKDDEEVQAIICTRLKAIGFESIVDAAKDIGECVIKCCDAVEKSVKNKKPYRFLFNTGTREKNGYYPIFPNEPYTPDDEEPSGSFTPGERVVVDGSVFDSEENYPGVVVSATEEEVEVKFDDDDSVDTIDISLVSLEEETAGEEEGEFKVGDAISVSPDHYGDGETYLGTISEINDDVATIEFEDGSLDDVPLSSVELS